MGDFNATLNENAGLLLQHNHGTINVNGAAAGHEALRRHQLLETLSGDDTRTGIPDAAPGTCQWFLHTEEYQLWRDSRRHSLFYLSAGPGCGKSVLCRLLVDGDHLPTLARHTDHQVVAHFFFRDGQEGRMTAADALTSLLHQILSSSKSDSVAMRHALQHFEKHGKNIRSRTATLWSIMKDVAGDTDGPLITCLVDAIDECEPVSRTLFLQMLTTHVQKSYLRRNQLKFLVSGRRYDDIVDEFRQLQRLARHSYICLDGNDHAEKISKDIDVYLEHRLESILASRPQSSRERIFARIRQGPQKTYLWLYLTLDWLSQMDKMRFPIARMEAELNKLPIKVSEYYDRILQRISAIDAALKILKFVLAAERPLTLDEINDAHAIACLRPNDDLAQAQDEMFLKTRIRDEVEGACGLFVQIYGNEVHLLHQTAREFLTTRSQSMDVEDSWQGTITMPEAHRQLAIPLLRFVLHDKRNGRQEGSRETSSALQVRSGDEPADGSKSLAARRARNEAPLNLLAQGTETIVGEALAGYAASAWKTHVQSCGNVADEEVLKLAADICKASAQPNAVGFAIKAGLEPVALHLISSGSRIDYSFNKTAPLASAIMAESETLVRVLLDAHVTLESLSTAPGSDPLALAAYRGNLPIVRMLINAGARPTFASNFRDYDALGITLQRSHTEILGEIIRFWNRSNAPKRSYFVGFKAALRRGKYIMAESLLTLLAEGPARSWSKKERERFTGRRPSSEYQWSEYERYAWPSYLKQASRRFCGLDPDASAASDDSSRYRSDALSGDESSSSEDEARVLPFHRRDARYRHAQRRDAQPGSGSSTETLVPSSRD